VWIMQRIPGKNDDCGEVQHELDLVSLALDAAGDSIIIHHADGTLVRFNEAAAMQMGLSVEQFAQLGPWGWAQPLPADARQERLTNLREHGEVSFVAPIVLRDGRHVLHDVRCRWIEAIGGPYIVAVSRDVTEQVKAHEVLEDLAFHDPLTGLANRALFDDRLELAMASARRHDDLLCIAFLDLDDFKSINDTYGHLVGDQVLIAVARRIERSVREEDTVARFGGDEFAVIFPRVASVTALEKLAEELKAAVREPVAVGTLRFESTSSVGLAVFQPDDDARALLMRADIEMYQAKRSSSTSRRAVLRQRG
jgi:diguanylate cyclase